MSIKHKKRRSVRKKSRTKAFTFLRDFFKLVQDKKILFFGRQNWILVLKVVCHYTKKLIS